MSSNRGLGRHKQWRTLRKKLRRKKIRQKIAQEQDKKLQKEQKKLECSPSYQEWLATQEELEEFAEEQDAKLQAEEEQKWLEAERLAQKKWIEWKEQQARIRKEKAEQEARIKKEWEEEQKKLKEEEDEKKRKQEEAQQKQESLMNQIAEFLTGGGEMPAESNLKGETNPNKALCPFFSKTGACRFGDRCSRDHPRPVISRVLLIPSFYSHFGMDQSLLDEYDSDLSLEYEDSETYQHFQEFYEDVLPEFENVGKIIQFKVCCNCEPHLRGNVYIEYSNERDAVQAYQKFHGRWYGGRQLMVEFSNISSWKSALCGLFHRKRCPKGKGCNFLHVFRNPRNEFAQADRDWTTSWHHQHRHAPTGPRSHRSRDESRSSRSSWRWSESPPHLEESERSTRQRSRKSSPKRHRGKEGHNNSNKRARSHDRKGERRKRKSRSRSR